MDLGQREYLIAGKEGGERLVAPVTATSAAAWAVICGMWVGVPDGDVRLVDLYERHYSAKRGTPRFTRLHSGISGPGQSMALISHTCDAGFIWLRNTVARYDGQKGVQCSFFRNESATLSSALILEAEQLAWTKWPGERLWTYVNPGKIRSTNPGFCFKKAGWRRCGESNGGLVILEKTP